MVDSDLKNHNLAFEIVKHRVEVDLPGVKVDVSGKDPNRGCFAGHDPNAFYKEESEAIEIPVADPELPDIPPEACAPARGFRTTLTSMNKAILLLPVTVIPIL